MVPDDYLPIIRLSLVTLWEARRWQQETFTVNVPLWNSKLRWHNAAREVKTDVTPAVLLHNKIVLQLHMLQLQQIGSNSMASSDWL